jgi:hypothetical protein
LGPKKVSISGPASKSLSPKAIQINRYTGNFVYMSFREHPNLPSRLAAKLTQRPKLKNSHACLPLGDELLSSSSRDGGGGERSWKVVCRQVAVGARRLRDAHARTAGFLSTLKC